MDYGLRVVSILALAGIAWVVLSKIDPMGGTDSSGAPVKSKVIITAVLLIVGAVLLLFSHAPAMAALDGAQRKSVYGGTYKSCLLSASTSAPMASQAEKRAWCTCYAEQVVDRVSPEDVKSFVPTSGPTKKMIAVANDAALYCKKMLY